MNQYTYSISFVDGDAGLCRRCGQYRKTSLQRIQRQDIGACIQSTILEYQYQPPNSIPKASNFVKHMKANKTLTYLDLSHNLIGSQVRVRLGPFLVGGGGVLCQRASTSETAMGRPTKGTPETAMGRCQQKVAMDRPW